MHYSVCVSAVFSRLPMPEAIAHVHEAGFDTCECWGWWDLDLAAVEKALKEHGVRLAAMCTRMVALNVPEKRQDFVSGLRETLDVVRQAFPVRTCARTIRPDRPTRPCVHYEIGQCLGPCAGLVSPEKYRELLEKVMEFLQTQESIGDDVVFSYIEEIARDELDYSYADEKIYYFVPSN